MPRQEKTPKKTCLYLYSPYGNIYAGKQVTKLSVTLSGDPISSVGVVNGDKVTTYNPVR